MGSNPLPESRSHSILGPSTCQNKPDAISALFQDAFARRRLPEILRALEQELHTEAYKLANACARYGLNLPALHIIVRSVSTILARV